HRVQSAAQPGRNLIQGETLFIAQCQEIAGSTRQTFQTELECAGAIRGVRCGTLVSIRYRLDSTRREGQGSPAFSFPALHDSLAGDTAGPGAKGTCRVITRVFFPENKSDVLENVVAGMGVADQRADECLQVRFVLEKSLKKFAVCVQ